MARIGTERRSHASTASPAAPVDGAEWRGAEALHATRGADSESGGAPSAVPESFAGPGRAAGLRERLGVAWAPSGWMSWVCSAVIVYDCDTLSVAVLYLLLEDRAVVISGDGWAWVVSDDSWCS